MNLSTPFWQGVVRGMYNGLGVGAFTTLTSMLADVNPQKAVMIGALAFLGALGFRSGEGVKDNLSDVKKAADAVIGGGAPVVIGGDVAVPVVPTVIPPEAP